MSAARLDNQTVVVTGGASQLGVAIARRFAQGGAFAILADLDREAGQRGAEALRGEGLAAGFEPLDVRDPGQSRALVARVAAERGSIDVWVNYAGAGATGPAETLPRGDWDDNLAATLSGAFYCAQAVGAHMLGRGRGVIVNIASTDAFQPIEGRVAASVAKAGVVMLTQALGIEWAGRGVRVVGVAPGALEGQSDPEGAHAHRVPMRRLGVLEEIAEAVYFLASGEASFVVGETMRVDGGWTAYHLF